MDEAPLCEVQAPGAARQQCCQVVQQVLPPFHSPQQALLVHLRQLRAGFAGCERRDTREIVVAPELPLIRCSICAETGIEAESTRCVFGKGAERHASHAATWYKAQTN